MRKYGILLILFGLLGAVFFALTDPRIMPPWIEYLGWGRNLVDASINALPGSLLGLVGSVVIMLTGFWLLVRRSV